VLPRDLWAFREFIGCGGDVKATRMSCRLRGHHGIHQDPQAVGRFYLKRNPPLKNLEGDPRYKAILR